jgi:hypothetical protein
MPVPSKGGVRPGLDPPGFTLAVSANSRYNDLSDMNQFNFNLQTLTSLNLLAGVGIGILCLLQVTRARQIQEQVTEVSRYNLKRQAVGNLIMESVQYAQKNPAIHPILTSAGLPPAALGLGESRGQTPTNSAHSQLLKATQP